jgi:hypothetical protein
VSDNPFGGLFGDLFKVLGQQGPNAWLETARSLALNVAQGEDGDPNPDPAQRQRLEQVAPLVARRVDALLSVPTTGEVLAVDRSALTIAALGHWAPLLTPLVTAAPPANSRGSRRSRLPTTRRYPRPADDRLPARIGGGPLLPNGPGRSRRSRCRVTRTTCTALS